ITEVLAKATGDQTDTFFGTFQILGHREHPRGHLGQGYDLDSHGRGVVPCPHAHHPVPLSR
ncbi:hypothetical protein ACWD25_55795, partial [Streptomyces sp. NPDC002920]